MISGSEFPTKHAPTGCRWLPVLRCGGRPSTPWPQEPKQRCLQWFGGLRLRVETCWNSKRNSVWKRRALCSVLVHRSIIDLFRSIHFGLTYWDVRCARTLGMSFGQPGSGVRFFEQCAIRLERSFHWACNWWTQGYDGYSVVWFIWYERR